MSTFALDVNSSPSDIITALNYAVSNLGTGGTGTTGNVLTANITTGEITTTSTNSAGYTDTTIVSYLYQYMDVKYANSSTGGSGFSSNCRMANYYGLRNTANTSISSNPADYIWNQVTGGFGTTKNLWYQTIGGRQVAFFAGNSAPQADFIAVPDNTPLNLDTVTSAQNNQIYNASAYFQSNTTPATPAGGTYNFATFTLTPPTGWSATIPSFVANTNVYISQAAFVGNSISTVAPSTTWTIPAIFTAQFNGNTGAQGQRGFVPLGYVIAPSDPTTANTSVLSSWFAASRANPSAPIGLGYTPIANDTAQFFYQDLFNPNNDITVVKAFDGNVWSNVAAQVVSGGLIVPGTITANTLNANQVYAITVQSTNATVGDNNSPGYWFQANTGNGRFGGNLNIGDNLIVGANATIGGNLSIGTGSTIGSYGKLNDNITIGNNLTVGNAAVIGTYLNVGANANIGTNLTVGQNANIGNNLTVGQNAYIGNNVTIANVITLGALNANTVGSTQITPNSITTDKIAANAITADTIAADAITADKIAANAITTGKIAAGAVTANTIASGTITGNLISGNTITAYNIASGTITGNLIAGNTIQGASIVAGSITATQLAANAIVVGDIVSTGATLGNISSPGYWLQNSTGNVRLGGNTWIGANLNVAGLISQGSLANAVVTTASLQSLTTYNIQFNAANPDIAQTPYVNNGLWPSNTRAYAIPAGVTITPTGNGSINGSRLVINYNTYLNFDANTTQGMVELWKSGVSYTYPNTFTSVSSIIPTKYQLQYFPSTVANNYTLFGGTYGNVGWTTDNSTFYFTSTATPISTATLSTITGFQQVTGPLGGNLNQLDPVYNYANGTIAIGPYTGNVTTPPSYNPVPYSAFATSNVAAGSMMTIVCQDLFNGNIYSTDGTLSAYTSIQVGPSGAWCYGSKYGPGQDNFSFSGNLTYPTVVSVVGTGNAIAQDRCPNPNSNAGFTTKTVTVGTAGRIFSSNITWNGLITDAHNNDYPGGNYLSSTARITTNSAGGNTYNLNGVACNWTTAGTQGNLFVAVGDYGTILSCPNTSNTWTKRSNPTNYNLRNVTYGGGRWLTVGTSGAMLTSTDGITWTSVSNPANGYALLGGQPRDLYDVSCNYGQTTFTVVGQGVIMTAPANNISSWTVKFDNGISYQTGNTRVQYFGSFSDINSANVIPSYQQLGNGQIVSGTYADYQFGTNQPQTYYLVVGNQSGANIYTQGASMTVTEYKK